MRIAIVSDIHGNRTAFEAVLADMRQTAPDRVYHGGDLSDGGSSPVEIVDRIRDLGWPGVAGNTDEMIFRPESLEEFASGVPPLAEVFAVVREMAAWTRARLGEERIAWLRSLPDRQGNEQFALVHASPESRWRAPAASASDPEFESVYAPLERPIAVYGHIHVPHIRRLQKLTVVNFGRAGLPYDGDWRASYLLLDEDRPVLRRVEYDVDGECEALRDSGIPRAEWVAKCLRLGRFHSI